MIFQFETLEPFIATFKPRRFYCEFVLHVHIGKFYVLHWLIGWYIDDVWEPFDDLERCLVEYLIGTKLLSDIFWSYTIWTSSNIIKYNGE